MMTAEQSTKIRAPQTLNRTPVKVASLHSSLKFVMGVVYSQELLRYSVEKFTEELADKKVVKI